MRSLLVEARELDEVGPLGDLHLSGLLEEVGEADDELLLANVFHARHFYSFLKRFLTTKTENVTERCHILT